MKKVAIIIPVHNNAVYLGKCLEAVLPEAREQKWEVIVVDDASTDSSSVIAEDKGAKVVKLTRNVGVSAARNAGVRATDAEILIFVDSDVVASTGTLSNMVEILLKRPEIKVVGAYPCPGDLSSEWSAHFVGLRSAWGYHWVEGETERRFSSIQSECGALRRSVFEELDGFSERHGGVGMEEFHMAHELERRGYGHILLRAASYRHHYKTLGRRCRALFDRTARWVPLLFQRRKFESRGAVGTADAAFSCLLTFVALVSLLLGFLTPWSLVVAALAWLIQLIIELPFLRFAYKIYGLRMALYALPALQVMHVAIGLGFLWGCSGFLFLVRNTKID